MLYEVVSSILLSIEANIFYQVKHKVCAWMCVCALCCVYVCERQSQSMALLGKPHNTAKCTVMIARQSKVIMPNFIKKVTIESLKSHWCKYWCGKVGRRGERIEDERKNDRASTVRHGLVFTASNIWWCLKCDVWLWIWHNSSTQKTHFSLSSF